MTRFVATFLIFCSIIGVFQAADISESRKLHSDESDDLGEKSPDAKKALIEKRSTHLRSFLGCDCFLPLGMESGRLPDSSLTASTSYDANHTPELSRLNKIPIKGKAGAWCARSNDANQWLQVSFGRETTVSKVATQGRYDLDQWVTSYTLTHSVDGNRWVSYRLSDGIVKVFGGNVDRHTPVYHLLHPQIKAKYIRFHPKTWSGHISMRAEVFGCIGHHCFMSLGLEDGRIQDSAMSASSSYNSNHAAKLGRLNLVAKSGNAGAWCALKLDTNQWLQIDLSVPTTVTKVVTQGRQDVDQWVTSFTLSHSLHGSHWVNYMEHGKKKVFRGNFDRNSIVVNEVYPPIHARFVRINPLTWSRHMSMRAELNGCPIKGI